MLLLMLLMLIQVETRDNALEQFKQQAGHGEKQALESRQRLAMEVSKNYC